MLTTLIVLAALVVVYGIHVTSFRMGARSAEWQAEMASTVEGFTEQVDEFRKELAALDNSQSQQSNTIGERVAKNTATLGKLDENVGKLCALLERGRLLRRDEQQGHGQPETLGRAPADSGWGARSPETATHPSPPATLRSKPGLESPV